MPSLPLPVIAELKTLTFISPDYEKEIAWDLI
jgi:hypothetical protein